MRDAQEIEDLMRKSIKLTRAIISRSHQTRNHAQEVIDQSQQVIEVVLQEVDRRRAGRTRLKAAERTYGDLQ